MLFLIQSQHAWRGVWQRPHHLASQFAAASHGVRYVEPRYLKWMLTESGRFFQTRSETPDRRIEVEPVTLINGERWGWIRQHNLNTYARELGKAPAFDFEGARVLWLYDPHQVGLAEKVPHDLLIYDIMDDYTAFPWAPRDIVAEERQLLSEADWTFAGTRALFDGKGAHTGGKIECILSGVDVEHFRKPDVDAPLPTAMRELQGAYKRFLGYAGVIDLRIDQEAVVLAAKAFRDCAFIFLGPVVCDVSRMDALPNVYLMGQKRYDELPGYYHAWDAAMIPFVENEVTRHINPTKILEYAAAGLPVVTRALPDVKRYYSDGAWLYEDREGFLHQLREIIGSDIAPRENPELLRRKHQAMAWADERSWSALAGQMLNRLGELLEK